MDGLRDGQGLKDGAGLREAACTGTGQDQMSCHTASRKQRREFSCAAQARATAACCKRQTVDRLPTPLSQVEAVVLLTWGGEGRLGSEWLGGLGDGAGGTVDGGPVAARALQPARDAKVLVAQSVRLQLRDGLGQGAWGGLRGHCGALGHKELGGPLRLRQLGQGRWLGQRLEDRPGLGQAACARSAVRERNSLERRDRALCLLWLSDAALPSQEKHHLGQF